MTSDNFSEPHTVSDVDNDLANLERIYQQVAAYQAPGRLFVEAVEAIDWQRKPPEFFREAIDRALGVGALAIARGLANSGHELYPDDDYLSRAAHVLAPPKVIATNRPAIKGLSKTMEWFREHSQEYHGLWVAVEEGTLIGSAPTRKALVDALGDRSDSPNMVITRIL